MRTQISGSRTTRSCPRLTPTSLASRRGSVGDDHTPRPARRTDAARGSKPRCRRPVPPSLPPRCRRLRGGAASWPEPAARPPRPPAAPAPRASRPAERPALSRAGPAPCPARARPRATLALPRELPRRRRYQRSSWRAHALLLPRSPRRLRSPREEPAIFLYCRSDKTHVEEEGAPAPAAGFRSTPECRSRSPTAC